MKPLQREAWGPVGDPGCHLSLPELKAGLAALPEEGTDTGRVRLICRRLADGQRETPQRAQLSVENGLEGDGWGRRPPRELEAQIAVINHAVAGLLANGQPVTHSGDNLYVELDISASNLPSGTRLGVGEAVLEVTPKPHNGCAKFHDRFGPEALRFVQNSAQRHLNLRGIYWRVIRSGRVWVDAPIQVLGRERDRPEDRSRSNHEPGHDELHE